VSLEKVDIDFGLSADPDFDIVGGDCVDEGKWDELGEASSDGVYLDLGLVDPGLDDLVDEVESVFESRGLRKLGKGT
jgi:hypothetical protein